MVKVEVWGAIDVVTLRLVGNEIKRVLGQNIKVANPVGGHWDFVDSDLPHGYVIRPCVWITDPSLGEMKYADITVVKERRKKALLRALKKFDIQELEFC